MDKLTIFLSYAAAQKRVAGELKSWFEGLAGIETFVAHDDMVGGSQFLEVILSGIKSADLFICILSDEYRASDYCDQELGIAFALNKKILPIKHNLNPYGFIMGTHAFTPIFNSKIDTERLFNDIIAPLLKEKDKNLKTKLLNTLVSKLVESESYDQSYKLISLLLNNAHELGKSQADSILKAYKNNINVTKAYNVLKFINKLVNSD